MTTITIEENTTGLPKTFRTIAACAKFFAQYHFETKVLEDFQAAKKLPKSAWKSI